MVSPAGSKANASAVQSPGSDSLLGSSWGNEVRAPLSVHHRMPLKCFAGPGWQWQYRLDFGCFHRAWVERARCSGQDTPRNFALLNPPLDVCAMSHQASSSSCCCRCRISSKEPAPLNFSVSLSHILSSPSSSTTTTTATTAPSSPKPKPHSLSNCTSPLCNTPNPASWPCLPSQHLHIPSPAGPHADSILQHGRHYAIRGGHDDGPGPRPRKPQD